MPYLKEEFKIKSLAIFGSQANNTANYGSDLDIIVEFHETIGLKMVDLVYYLEEKTGLSIDLASRESLTESFLNYIKEDLIYAN